ncbi:ribonuclease 1 [Cajanus cajan]|uniref:Intracellular ribonuclease LX n=1 Tax=Cajanus cajan TaxID=3821 RepID=A0A151QSW0_CAJCA|nr:ribonuclease 1 [Cajanus cajan]KYP33408.1 Intracellular ribonuclease LX [Cajanus cajan]
MESISSISIKLLMLLALVNICVSQDFDFFYFVQQWPGSFCDTQKSCCFPPTGKPAANFSIHGLWPNFSNGSYPSNCNIAENTFNQSKIIDLIPRAETSWPSLSCAGGKTDKNITNSDNKRFWKHEWDKHGTCSVKNLDQHAYFEAALNFKDRVDLLQILLYNGIKPDGNFYSVVSITEAIKEATGFEPGITCNTDPSGNRQLHEIYLCADTSASNFIECPILPNGKSCSEKVEFPIFYQLWEEL